MPRIALINVPNSNIQNKKKTEAEKRDALIAAMSDISPESALRSRRKEEESPDNTEERATETIEKTADREIQVFNAITVARTGILQGTAR